MHVLFVLDELPYPASRNGVSLINFEILTRAPNDIKISLLIAGREEHTHSINNFRSLCPSIEHITFLAVSSNRFYRLVNLISGILFKRKILSSRAFNKFFRNNGRRFDVIYISPLLSGADFRMQQPVFLNAVDSLVSYNRNAYESSNKLVDLLKTHFYTAFEKSVLPANGLINFVSSFDCRDVQNRIPNLKLVNITNGINLNAFVPSEQRIIPGRLLFTGNFDYQPNRDAATYLVYELFPEILSVRPDATLQIVGRNPPAEFSGRPGIQITGFVEDIIPYYQEAEVFVCPMLSGAGVKNKILESLSTGLPVVSTPLGVRGLDHLVDGTHYISAINKREFVDSVLLLLDNQSLRDHLRSNSRDIIEKHYDWQPIVDSYYDAMRSLAS